MRLPFIKFIHWNALKDKMEIFDIMPRCIYMHMEIQKSPWSLLLNLINIVSFINVEKPQKMSHTYFNYTIQFVSFSSSYNQYPTIWLSVALTAAFFFFNWFVSEFYCYGFIVQLRITTFFCNVVYDHRKNVRGTWIIYHLLL